MAADPYRCVHCLVYMDKDYAKTHLYRGMEGWCCLNVGDCLRRIATNASLKRLARANIRF